MIYPISELFESAIQGPWRTAGTDVQYRIERSASIVTVTFQGSASRSDWVHDFMFFPGFVRWLFSHLRLPKVPYKNMAFRWLAHAGFVDLWKSASDAIMHELSLEISKEETAMVFVEGYSLGAAMALLLHEALRFSYPSLRIMTRVFGCPRVFFFPPKKLRDRMGAAIRYTNPGDVVTVVPPVLMGYSHVGIAVPLSNQKRFPLPKYHLIDSYRKTFSEEHL